MANWDSMTPRERDALVAEKLFGWRWLTYLGFVWFGLPESIGEKHTYDTTREADEEDLLNGTREDEWWLAEDEQSISLPVVPHFSTDMAASWQVVERMRAKRWLVVIKVMPEGFPYWYDQDDPRHFYARTVVSADYQPMKTQEDTRRYIHGHAMGVANSDAEAICKCGLAVVEAEERYPVTDPVTDIVEV